LELKVKVGGKKVNLLKEFGGRNALTSRHPKEGKRGTVRKRTCISSSKISFNDEGTRETIWNGKGRFRGGRLGQSLLTGRGKRLTEGKKKHFLPRFWGTVTF